MTGSSLPVPLTSDPENSLGEHKRWLYCSHSCGEWEWDSDVYHFHISLVREKREGIRIHSMSPRSPFLPQSQQESQVGHFGPANMAAKFGRLHSLRKPVLMVVRTVAQRKKSSVLSPWKWGKGQQGHLSIVSRTESVLQAKRASGKWKKVGSPKLS